MKPYDFPTERIDLPSKGLLYPETSPLRSGYVDLKYLSAREEDILTNKNYIAQDIVVDKLIEALVVTPNFDPKELLAGDVDAIFYACRILSYGSEYQYPEIHPVTRKEAIATCDLNDITHKPLADVVKTATSNEFEFELPKAKINITFKLLTRADRDAIVQEETAWKKLFPDKTYQRTLFLIKSITSVGGNRSEQVIREFIEKGTMSAMDANKLRQYIYSISPGLDIKVNVTFDENTSVEAEVPIRHTFLWPDTL